MKGTLWGTLQGYPDTRSVHTHLLLLVATHNVVLYLWAGYTCGYTCGLHRLTCGLYLWAGYTCGLYLWAIPDMGYTCGLYLPPRSPRAATACPHTAQLPLKLPLHTKHTAPAGCERCAPHQSISATPFHAPLHHSFVITRLINRSMQGPRFAMLVYLAMMLSTVHGWGLPSDNKTSSLSSNESEITGGADGTRSAAATGLQRGL